MFMTVEFTVLGTPVGKERPRFVRIGNHIRTYTPRKTKDYERKVKQSYKEQITHGRLLEGAIKAELVAVFPIPKSVTKKRREEMLAGEVPCTKHLDLDNCIKGIFDGLNGVAYKDDASIDEIYARQMYGDNPRCEVRLTDDKHTVVPLFYVNEKE